MRAYELMVIIDAELDDEVIDATVKRIAGLLDQRGATVKKEDRWGRRRFAYEINHKHEGYYVVWSLWGAATSTSRARVRLADETVRHKSWPARNEAAVGPRRARLPSRGSMSSTSPSWAMTRDPAPLHARRRPGHTFGVAVNRRWQNRDNQQWEESTSFFNVTCWRDLAQNVSESLEKGARVLVTGRLEQRSWETQDGERRSVVEIVADEVGPSLRWATADIARNERRDGDGGGWSGGGNSGGGSSSSSSGSSRSVSNEAPTNFDPSEEPF